MKINFNKQINIVVFVFGFVTGSSIGVALPDGNLLVTAIMATASGLLILGGWIAIKRAKKLLSKIC